MSEQLIPIPSDCSLVYDSSRPRMSASQCALTINCLIRDNGPRDLSLTSTTGMKGKPGMEWVEASAQFQEGFYRWAFLVRGGFITNCFMAQSPKGSQYSINHDGGSPFDDVTIEDRKALTHLLIGSQRQDSGIELVPAWIICTNGTRPYAAHIHWSKEEGDAALIEQLAHFAKYNKSLDTQSTEKAEEKQKIKESNTVAFKAKKKGLSKK